MNTPEWTKPALTGAGIGAIVLAIVGFSWGGWMTSGSAKDMSNKQSTAAVAAVLTPYCVEMSKSDPKKADVLAELDAAAKFRRRGVIEEAGWATPLGAEKPDRALAEACQAALADEI